MTPSAPRFTDGRRATSAYASIGLETQVRSARPEHLITLLFDGALAAISRARLPMRQGDIEGRGLAISRAIDIIDSGLKASVDCKAGGDLAQNLIAVYSLAIRNLMLANLHADSARLDLAERLLADIGDAWRVNVDTAQ